MGQARISFTEAQEKARKHGYEFADLSFQGYSTPHQFRCKNGHTFHSRAGNVLSGVGGCPECWRERRGRNSRIDTVRIMEAAAVRGGQILTDLSNYQNMKQKVLVRCAQGHEFEVSIGYLLSGKESAWCPTCSEAAMPHRQAVRAIKKAEALVASRGGHILTTAADWNGSRGHYRIQCPEDGGHEFSMTLQNLKKGHFCPQHRQGRTWWTINLLKTTAAARGGECLSPEYIGCDKKHNWRCIAGHEWEAQPYKVITDGTWCPRCRNKGELLCRAVFEKIFGRAFVSVRPVWLRNPDTDSPLQLDGFSSHERILSGPHVGKLLAFEYQGLQHYKKTIFHKDDAEFLAQQARDVFKAKRCAEEGVLLVHVPAFPGGPYGDIEGAFRHVEEILDSMEVPMAPHERHLTHEEFTTDLKATFLKLAADKACRVVGEYRGEGIQVEMMCPKGHMFKPKPFNFRRNGWCRTFTWTDRITGHPSGNTTIEDFLQTEILYLRH